MALLSSFLQLLMLLLLLLILLSFVSIVNTVVAALEGHGRDSAPSEISARPHSWRSACRETRGAPVSGATSRAAKAIEPSIWSGPPYRSGVRTSWSTPSPIDCCVRSKLRFERCCAGRTRRTLDPGLECPAKRTSAPARRMARRAISARCCRSRAR